jgi:hypothetical protein
VHADEGAGRHLGDRDDAVARPRRGRDAGAITLVGRIGSKVVARGSALAKEGGTVRVRLRATRDARKRLARLRGKSLVVRVSAGGRSTTVRRKLR